MQFALPPAAAGQWCILRLALPVTGVWWARVELTDPGRSQVVHSVFLGKLHAAPGRPAWRATLLHVPAGAASGRLRLFGAPEHDAEITVRVLGRAGAAARLLWHGRSLLWRCVRGSPLGLFGRLRAVLGQAPARAGEAPPYSAWIALCEASLPGPPDAGTPDIQAALVGAADAASLASLAVQTMPATRPPCIITTPADWAGIRAPWVVVLGAGEVLAPHALAWFAAAAAADPAATFITADCDRLGADGTRHDPLFLPGADDLLLRTGLPVTGPCAVRWHTPPALPADAAMARRALARRVTAGRAHVPRILSHVPHAAAATPFILPREAAYVPRVTALVPSRARSLHAAQCLRQVRAGTAYPRLRIEVLLSAPGQASPRVLHRLRAVPDLHVRELPRPAFNYAAINNQAAATADADLLLLLNDDVAPLAPGWLDAMVAHMQDPRVGIVGARLLYGNGMVQHEGVILGLADLCEHAGRLRAGTDPGPHGIGRLTRLVSAVTAACLLIRTSLYREIGGMDEGFAIALNDVDLCLRARQAGWLIVYCAEAELFHYESLSLGRHYGGSRAALESVEVHRLRQRWAGVIAADPCYNPLASLEPGREWQPAFPPRGGQTPASASNPPAAD